MDVFLRMSQVERGTFKVGKLVGTTSMERQGEYTPPLRFSLGVIF